MGSGGRAQGGCRLAGVLLKLIVSPRAFRQCKIHNAMQKFKVTFYPDDVTVEVARILRSWQPRSPPEFMSIQAAAGRCVLPRKVMVKSGIVLSHSPGRITAGGTKGVYLACMSVVAGGPGGGNPPESRLSLEGLTQEETRRAKKDISEPEEIESGKQDLLQELLPARL